MLSARDGLRCGAVRGRFLSALVVTRRWSVRPRHRNIVAQVRFGTRAALGWALAVGPPGVAVQQRAAPARSMALETRRVATEDVLHRPAHLSKRAAVLQRLADGRQQVLA